MRYTYSSKIKFFAMNKHISCVTQISLNSRVTDERLQVQFSDDSNRVIVLSACSDNIHGASQPATLIKCFKKKNSKIQKRLASTRTILITDLNQCTERKVCLVFVAITA